MSSKTKVRFGSEAAVTALLVLVVLGLNGIAVWGIVSARAAARRAAREELALQTAAHARALEAALATLRGDFLFLSQSPPLAKALSVLASGDPMVSRWGRLDVDASLLLFLEAHPSVERVVVRDRRRGPLVVAGRRGGAPSLMLPNEENGRPREAGTLWPMVWSLGSHEREAGAIEAWLSPSRLVGDALPGLDGRLSILLRAAPASGDPLAFRASVEEPRFHPPVAWTLERRESRLNAPLESLAGHALPAVLLNGTSMVLALLLGLLALREVRRSAQLEADRRQQELVRELERQVQHNERLASVGRLAAGLAHEINNPLEGMSNYLAVLEQDLREERPRQALELVPLVREGLHRAAGITRQVLRYADPGKAPKDAVPLDDVLRSAARFVRGNKAFRGVELTLSLPREPLTVMGNRTTLDQLFLNLLVNACEAQEGSGAVELAAYRDGGRVMVTVADQGPGLPEEARRHLFEPFASFRGSTGLGLSVCHGIVREHGGAIRGENRPGGGAQFQVEIPLMEGA